MVGFSITLRRGALTLEIDRRGAVITSFTRTTSDGTSRNLMRAARDYDGDPLKAACFPLIPFGNRVAGNRFTVADRTYDLAPNQPWDRHYLHGDGWLNTWAIEKATDNLVELTLRHEAVNGRPYTYKARIVYDLTSEGALAVEMAVLNTGSDPLPFGLGLHPYFPLTPLTELEAPAQAFFTEEAEFMPGPRTGIPADLDFARSRALPCRWINNGFAGWTGKARIAWPEYNLALKVGAETNFGDYFVFMSDKTFEPAFAGDYFCFEPMTHQADGHHAADLGGLTLLAPGEALAGRVLFTPEEMLA